MQNYSIPFILFCLSLSHNLLEDSFKSIVYSVCLHLDKVNLMSLSSTAQVFNISYFFTCLLVSTLQPESPIYRAMQIISSQFIIQCIPYRIFQIWLQTFFANLNNHDNPFLSLFVAPNTFMFLRHALLLGLCTCSGSSLFLFHYSKIKIT